MYNNFVRYPNELIKLNIRLIMNEIVEFIFGPCNYVQICLFACSFHLVIIFYANSVHRPFFME